MSRKLLTLAIAYNIRTEGYWVIVYDLLKEKIFPLELLKSDIQGKNGVYFDIGAVTEVEELREGEIIYPVGHKKIIEAMSRTKVKDFLDNQYINIEEFYRNRIVNSYSVIKVSSLMELSVTKTKLGLLPKISFYANGVLKKGVYINDYRWVQYIRHVALQKDWQKQIEEYKAFLTSDSKTIYLIMNKVISDNMKVYIAGLHCL